MLNHCTFIGNLGADPELRSTANSSVANFTLACTEKWKKDGEQKERTEWVKCVVWGPLTGIMQYLHKGSKVYVAGSMQTRKWQDKEGRDQYTTEINVQTLKLLDPKPAKTGSSPVTDEDGIPF